MGGGEWAPPPTARRGATPWGGAGPQRLERGREQTRRARESAAHQHHRRHRCALLLRWPTPGRCFRPSFRTALTHFVAVFRVSAVCVEAGEQTPTTCACALVSPPIVTLKTLALAGSASLRLDRFLFVEFSCRAATLSRAYPRSQKTANSARRDAGASRNGRCGFLPTPLSAPRKRPLGWPAALAE